LNGEVMEHGETEAVPETVPAMEAQTTNGEAGAIPSRETIAIPPVEKQVNGDQSLVEVQ